jgi:hypothetical protein
MGKCSLYIYNNIHLAKTNIGQILNRGLPKWFFFLTDYKTTELPKSLTIFKCQRFRWYTFEQKKALPFHFTYTKRTHF